MSGKELQAVAVEIARHLRWTQPLGEEHLPSPRPEAPAAGTAGSLEKADLPLSLRPGESRDPVGNVQSERTLTPAPSPDERERGGTAARDPSLRRSEGLEGKEPRAEGRGNHSLRPGESRDPVDTEAPAARLPAARLLELGVASPALQAVRDELGDCRRCKLCQGRRNLVFGTGDPKARLVFVGEGPGSDEDAQGIPFVGAAGQLLTRMIEAMGLRREEVYICNVVKCRPPGNRAPEADEVEACEPFLQAQLRAIGPEVIVALGRSAAQSLLREDTPITRLRGQWRRYQGVELMPTFHPAYLLRSPQEKAKVWADLQQVMRRLGLPRRR